MNTVNSILVTGGTGSFGQAFIPHLLLNPTIQRICIYSRGEHTQAAMRIALGDNPRLRWMIGDIRDVDRLKRAMHGIDAVVHAAALKRIETGAYNPDEMVKTNILGTMNVIEAAVANHVRWVVGLSSDKAYQPVSPYGQSKALAESLLLAANQIHGSSTTKFAATRYGNIWGAQGSVVPYWRDLISKGATSLPVTDLECTRFFMTIDEAVLMVYNLLMHMKGNELVIPDWLPAYRLGDLVEAFDRHPSVKGLPSWEKRHESMNDKLCSSDARRMTIAELKELIENDIA